MSKLPKNGAVRRLLIGFGVSSVFTATLLVVTGISLARWSGATTTLQEEKAAVKRAHAAGLPIATEDLAVRPPIPVDQDASPVLLKFRAAEQKDWDGFETLLARSVTSNGGFDPVALDIILARHADLVNLAEAAAEYPRCDFHSERINNDDSRLLHSARSSAHILLARATMLGVRGDDKGAIDDLRRSDRLISNIQDQFDLDNSGSPLWLHKLQSKVVQRLADAWQDDPGRLSNLSAYVHQPQQARSIRAYLGHELLASESDLILHQDEGKSVGLPKSITHPMIKSQVIKYVDWAVAVSETAGDSNSIEDWRQAVNSVNTSFHKKDFLQKGAFDAFGSSSFPLDGADLDIFQEEINFRRVVAIYVDLLLGRAEGKGLPESRPEKWLHYAKKDDGFDLWVLPLGTPPKPLKILDEFLFRPRSG